MPNLSASKIYNPYSEEGHIAYQRECKAAAIASNDCYKCNGKGTIRGFGHIDGGKCFACNGTGKNRKLRVA